MSNFIINITDGTNYSRPVVNRFSSDFDRVRFVMDLSKDMSNYSFGLAASVSGECFMLTEDNEKLIRSTEESTGRILIDWIVGTEVTALDGVVTYQLIAYTSDSDGNIQSMWYSPQGRLMVSESLSLTEYENAEIGTKPSLLMQILSKLNKDELDISTLQNAVNTHITTETIDHPDGSVTRPKLSEDINKILDDAITEPELNLILEPLKSGQNSHENRIFTAENAIAQNSQSIAGLTKAYENQNMLLNQTSSLASENAKAVDNISKNLSEIEEKTDKLQIQSDNNTALTDKSRIIVSQNGEFISLDDSDDMPIRKLKLCGKTNQTRTKGKNLIPFPYYDGKTKTANGITFIQNDDGSVTISGTATAKAIYTLMSDYSFVSNFIPSGSYTITAGSDLVGTKTFMVQAKIDYNNKANYIYFQDQGSSLKTTTIPEGVTDAHVTIVNLVVNEGYTAENVTIYPMLERSATPTAYEPYTGGVPTPSAEYPQGFNSIGTKGEIKVSINGKNHIPFPYKKIASSYTNQYGLTEDATTGSVNGVTFVVNNDGSVTFFGTASETSKFYLIHHTESPKIPEGKYTLSGCPAEGDLFSYYMSVSLIDLSTGIRILEKNDYGDGMNININDNVKVEIVFNIVKGATLNNIIIRPQFEKGETPTEYESYKNQSVTIPAPNDLPGVPVYDPDFNIHPDCTYKDESGQMYICDEIDLDKGVYIKRIDEHIVSIDEVLTENGMYIFIDNSLSFVPEDTKNALWEAGGEVNLSNCADVFSVITKNEDNQPITPFIVISSLDKSATDYTADELKNMYNGTKMLLVRKEPIETPLPEEVLRMYKGVHTYKPCTNISNSENAFMKTEYTADTKNYIDNKLTLIESAIISLGGNI